MNRISIASIFSFILCLAGVRADVVLVPPAQSLLEDPRIISIIWIVLAVVIVLVVIWLVRRLMKRQTKGKKKK